MNKTPSERQSMLHTNVLNMAVIIAALGYFVDIYDLLLFGIVRIPSLQELGYGNDLLNKGTCLLNWQMGGMLLGGILWGILGDKRGRLSVLFGSIFLYSAANFFNGTIHSLNAYAACRFFAGVGLAGELGAGITLVSEVMTKENRGYGTTIVAAFGIFGAVIAGLVGALFNWRIAYYVGGGLGIALLILRVSAYESGMFHQFRKEVVSKGNFIALFTNRARFSKYIKIILIGLPIWYVIGILIFDSNDFANALHIAISPQTNKTTITPGTTIIYHYAGASLGALLCGFMSQYFRKRKKALLYFMLADAACVVIYMLMKNSSATSFYLFAFIFGVANGYWSVFMTVASEQFGTNIRATVTTTTPNFVRGSVVPLTILFVCLKGSTGNIVTAALIVGVIVLALAFFALWKTEETYGRDLEYVEEI